MSHNYPDNVNITYYRYCRAQLTRSRTQSDSTADESDTGSKTKVANPVLLMVDPLNTQIQHCFTFDAFQDSPVPRILTAGSQSSTESPPPVRESKVSRQETNLKLSKGWPSMVINLYLFEPYMYSILSGSFSLFTKITIVSLCRARSVHPDAQGSLPRSLSTEWSVSRPESLPPSPRSPALVGDILISGVWYAESCVAFFEPVNWSF